MTNPTGYTELDLVGFTDKGEYSPSANYVQNDIVQYNYVAWRCKVDDTTGITPTEGTNWTVFVGNPPSTSVTGVKGNAETDYRTGDVNLTPANIGAYSKSEVDTALNGKLGTSGASTNTTVAFTSNDLAANTTVKTNTTTNQPSTVAKLSSGETLASMFGKISSMFASIRKLWNTVGFETAQISKIIGDTSVTFNNSAITTNSELHLIADNSGTPVFYTGVTVSNGSATYTFPALTEATKFSLIIK